MIKYEFPLNERVRKFLRIEEIFKKMETQITIKKQFSDYSCFNTYFDIKSSVKQCPLCILKRIFFFGDFDYNFCLTSIVLFIQMKFYGKLFDLYF